MSRLDPEDAYLEALAWWRGTDPDYRSLLLSDFSVGFSFNSGAIENPSITYHDTREIFENNGVSSYTGDLRTLFEIANLKTAWGMILDRAQSRQPVTEAEILELHAALTHGTYDEARWRKGERPGSYKIGEYGVGMDAAIGCAAKDAQGLVRELVANMREYTDAGMEDGDELQLASYAHAALADIHPFADGNGRTARLLMNRVLLTFDAPPVCFHREDKLAYYEALDAYHRDDDLAPLELFSKLQLIKTWMPVLLREEIIADPDPSDLMARCQAAAAASEADGAARPARGIDQNAAPRQHPR